MSNSLFVQLLTEMGWDAQFKKYSKPVLYILLFLFIIISVYYSSYLFLFKFRDSRFITLHWHLKGM